jgi:hypothetical protein
VAVWVAVWVGEQTFPQGAESVMMMTIMIAAIYFQKINLIVGSEHISFCYFFCGPLCVFL